MFNPLSFIVDSTVSLVFSPPHSFKDDELEWSRLDEDELLDLQEKAQVCLLLPTTATLAWVLVTMKVWRI